MSLRSQQDLFLALKHTFTDDGQVKTLSAFGGNRVYTETHELTHMDLSYRPIMVRLMDSTSAGPIPMVQSNIVDAQFTFLHDRSYKKGTSSSDTGGIHLRVRSVKTFPAIHH